jgi:hypothetical protein
MPNFTSPILSPIVTSSYGKERSTGIHQGVDLVSGVGDTNIKSVGDGTVVGVGPNTDTRGNWVTIDHGDGYTSSYYHLKNQSPLNVGDKVVGGQSIGEMGSTGRSEGTHLHLQMTKDGQKFDPMLALRGDVTLPDPSSPGGVTPGGTSGSPQNAQSTARTTVHKPEPQTVPHVSVERGSDTLDGEPPDWSQPYDPHQAYFALSDLYIGDRVIVPTAPQRVNSHDETGGLDLRLEEFQYSIKSQGGNRALWRLFIRSWQDVEEIMALAEQKQSCSFSFGYTDIEGGWVGPFNARIIGITPQFLQNGYSVSIEAIDDGTYQNAVKGPQTRSWQAIDGHISDIVAAIAQMNGWDTCIEETVPMPKERVYYQSQQTDLNFIIYVLAPLATSAVSRKHVTSDGGGGFGPYRCYLTQSATTKRITLHFHPVSAAQGSKADKLQREYVWGGVSNAATHEYGTVISFNPEYMSTAFAVLGASKFQGTSIDVAYKNVNTVTAQGTDLEDRVMNSKAGGRAVQVNLHNDVPSRADTYVHHDIEYLKSVTGAHMFALRDLCFKASMEVLGDPYLIPFIKINVMVVRPIDGVLMYYDWQVVNVVHTIVGGEFKTSMDLLRTPTGIREGDKRYPGGGIGAGTSYTQSTSVNASKKGMVVGG